MDKGKGRRQVVGQSGEHMEVKGGEGKAGHKSPPKKDRMGKGKVVNQPVVGNVLPRWGWG